MSLIVYRVHSFYRCGKRLRINPDNLRQAPKLAVRAKVRRYSARGPYDSAAITSLRSMNDLLDSPRQVSEILILHWPTYRRLGRRNIPDRARRLFGGTSAGLHYYETCSRRATSGLYVDPIIGRRRGALAWFAEEASGNEGFVGKDWRQLLDAWVFRFQHRTRSLTGIRRESVAAMRPHCAG